MSDKKCFCVDTAFEAIGDLIQACERMIDSIGDRDVRQYMHGYKDGVMAVGNRYRTTQGKCCCQRYDIKKDS